MGGGGGGGGGGEVTGARLVATIVKSFIGSGVLFLPKAFSNGGWLFSILAMVFMAAVTNLCILRLVACRQVVAGTYGEVGRAAVGKWGQVAVDISLVLSQAGFCCVYVVFIARNVLQMLNTSSCWLGGEWLWLLVLLEWPLFTPLTWVRRIAAFGPTNIAADVFIAGGLAAVLGFSIHGMATADGPTGGVPVGVPAFNSGSFSLMLGTAVYAFEGVGMVVPVYDSLSPAGQARFPRTLSLTLAGVAAVYIVVGLLPYLYLAGVAHVPLQDAVTLNLPRTWWSLLVTAGYCVALLFSYPYMLFPAVAILEAAAEPHIMPAGWAAARRKSSGGAKEGGGGGSRRGTEEEALALALNSGGSGEEGEGEEAEEGEDESAAPAGGGLSVMWRRNLFRAAVVAVTLLVAYLGSEQLDNFVSLIGCFCCTPLAFIYPSLFHVKLLPNAPSWSRALDWAIVAFGAGVLVFSTYEAIAGWSIQTINPCV